MVDSQINAAFSIDASSRIYWDNLRRSSAWKNASIALSGANDHVTCLTW